MGYTVDPIFENFKSCKIKQGDPKTEDVGKEGGNRSFSPGVVELTPWS
jgi:hypothetical protein